MTGKKIFRVTCTVLATTVLVTSPLSAQRITGQISGKISDPSLAGLGGVTVELTSDNIIGTRTTVTTGRGHYRFITVPTGFYNMAFHHPGFKTELLRHVPVAVGTTTRRDLTLQVASMTETIHVTAEASAAASVGLSQNEVRLRRLTASKRSQSQQEAPVSIAAFDAPALENRTMYDLSDLADFTPNLEFGTSSSSGGTRNNATVYIRGLGQVDNRLWFDPGVAIYLDGVYLARSLGAVLSLVDVEVVEVLRGPQGTLFGKNTLGGAISIVTRKPGSELAGHAELTVGSFDRVNASGRVSGSLSPGFFGSLSVASTNADGFTRSLATGQDYSDDNSESVRVAGHWQPSKSATVDWTGDTSREREHGADNILTRVQQAPLLDFYNRALTLAGELPLDERWVPGNLRESYSTAPSFARIDILGVSFDTHSLPRANLSVRSITSYRQLDSSGMNDLDGSPIEVAALSERASHRQWTEELWLSGLSASDRLTWILGGFYFGEESHVESHFSILGDVFRTLEAVPGPIVSPPGVPALLCDPGPPPPGVPCFGGAGNPANLLWFNGFGGQSSKEAPTHSYALFGEATMDLSDRLSLTAGLRFSYEGKEFRPTNTNAFEVVDFDYRYEESWSSATARFNLAFQATPELMLYVAAANGFKGGGFNENAIRSFAPERVWSYEAGSKMSLLSNRLRIDAAIFWSEYTDLQLIVFPEESMLPEIRVPFINNAGQAEVTGFDVDLRAQLADSFRIDAGVGYLDAEYTRLEDSVSGVTLDGTFPRTPEWNLVVSPEYLFRIGNGGTLVFHADYTYKTRIFFDATNDVIQGAYGLVNARMSFISRSGAWEAYAYGTNLEDKMYKEHGGFASGFGLTLAVAGRPREWGIGLKYRF